MKTMKMIMAFVLAITSAWAGAVTSNLVAEVMPTVTNLVLLPTDEAVDILKADAKSEWAKVAAQMSNSLANANQELRGLQEGKPLGEKCALNPEQSNVVARLKGEQARTQEELMNIRLRLRARIQALEDLKRRAEPQGGGYSPPAARSDQPGS